MSNINRDQVNADTPLSHNINTKPSSQLNNSTTSQDETSGWQNYPQNIALNNHNPSDAGKKIPDHNDLSDAIMQEVIRENSLLDNIAVNEKPGDKDIPTPRVFSEASATQLFDPEIKDANSSAEVILPASMFPTEHHHSGYNININEPHEQIQNEAFERWLNKPTPEKSDNTSTIRMAVGVASIAVTALIVSGIYFSGTLTNTSGSINQFVGKGPKQSATKNSNISKNNLSNNSTSNGGTNGATSNNGSNGTLKTAAASFTVTPAIGQIGNKCQPDINLTALDGGRSQIDISSICHKNEEIKIKYADITFLRTLDKDGNLNFILDGFSGNKTPVEFIFSDNQNVTRIPVFQDIENISKVAVLWTGKHDIDLHAFEYTATDNSPGHIWNKNTSSYKTAKEKIKTSGKGHGFISSSTKLSDSTNQKLEVYTFIHSPEQTDAVVKMALSYKTKNRVKIKKSSCNVRTPETLNYETLHLVKNGVLIRTQGALLVDECSRITQNQIRSKAIQDLEISE